MLNKGWYTYYKNLKDLSSQIHYNIKSWIMACRCQSKPAKQIGTNQIPENFELVAQGEIFAEQGLFSYLFLLVSILPWILREKAEGYQQRLVVDGVQPRTSVYLVCVARFW